MTVVVENGTLLPIMHNNWFSWTRRKEGDEGNSAGLIATDEQVDSDSGGQSPDSTLPHCSFLVIIFLDFRIMKYRDCINM